MTFLKKDLAEWACGEWRNDYRGAIDGFCYDSRICAKGDCFLAINSGKDDGHRYLASALNNGATAAIVEHFEPSCQINQLIVNNTVDAFQKIGKNYRKSLSTNIIGVTGSCGKTTAKELLWLLLGDNAFRTQNNYNNGIGVPLSLTQIDGKKHSHAVIEVGINTAGEMDLLEDILAPNVACVLNVEPVHIGKFDDDIQKLANEKSKILKNSKLKFFNKKLLQYNCFKNFQTNAFVISENNATKNELTYTANEINKVGWNVDFYDGLSHICTINIPFLISRGVLNTFAFVIFVAIKLGVALNEIQTRILHWKPMEKRGVWINKFFVDCYNANPISMLESMSTFAKQADPNKQHLYIIGQMQELGTNSNIYHHNLGKNIKARPTDLFWLIGQPNSSDVRNGLINANINPNNISIFDSTQTVNNTFLNAFNGLVFLKGSRYHKLESLVKMKTEE